MCTSTPHFYNIKAPLYAFLKRFYEDFFKPTCCEEAYIKLSVVHCTKPEGDAFIQAKHYLFHEAIFAHSDDVQHLTIQGTFKGSIRRLQSI